MQHRFSRTELLIGSEGLAKLEHSKVAVFGIGGVGSFTVEALARAGVGQLVLVDYDDVCLTNINRQLHALTSTMGKDKVQLMQERVLQINPKAKVTAIREFYTPEKGDEMVTQDLSYIVDAIDNVTGKLDLVKKAMGMGIPIVSAMGAGNKLDPTAFKVDDLSKTSVCPLAKVMRRELRKAGIKKGVNVVYSTEPPLTPKETASSCRDHCVCTNKDAISNCALRRQIPGSISFVPPVMGMILAGVVVNDLLGHPLTSK
ncbi:MAG: tRNA threonylcarbamoyladenosine dehydratase [Thermincolia bacterium]